MLDDNDIRRGKERWKKGLVRLGFQGNKRVRLELRRDSLLSQYQHLCTGQKASDLDPYDCEHFTGPQIFFDSRKLPSCYCYMPKLYINSYISPTFVQSLYIGLDNLVPNPWPSDKIRRETVNELVTKHLLFQTGVAIFKVICPDVANTKLTDEDIFAFAEKFVAIACNEPASEAATTEVLLAVDQINEVVSRNNHLGYIKALQ